MISNSETNNIPNGIQSTELVPPVKVTFDSVKQQHQQQEATQISSKIPTLVGPPPSSTENRRRENANSITTRDAYFTNGRNFQEPKVNFETYYKYKEVLPSRFHPLIQFLDDTELKYYNDNLFDNTPFGFPTRGILLKEKVNRLPIIKDTTAEKARYKRKCEEKQRNIVLARKKFDFKTHEGESSHCFLTGGRFNRNDTVDLKLLNKYGIFINKNNPSLVYFKSKSNHELSKPTQSQTNFTDKKSSKSILTSQSVYESNHSANNYKDSLSKERKYFFFGYLFSIYTSLLISQRDDRHYILH